MASELGHTELDDIHTYLTGAEDGCFFLHQCPDHFYLIFVKVGVSGDIVLIGQVVDDDTLWLDRDGIGFIFTTCA